MSIKPIAKLAGRYHSTGLNADRMMARQVFELYCRFQSVDVLEIGPGHTVEVLEEALRRIASRLYDASAIPNGYGN